MELNKDQNNTNDSDINNSIIVNVENINGVNIYLNELMKNVNETILNDIRYNFQQNINKRLNAKELHNVMKPYNIILPDEDLNPMFAKIDVKKEGTVDFLQFVSYLSFEFEMKRKQKNQNVHGKLSLTPQLLKNEFNKGGNNGQYEIKGIASKLMDIKSQFILPQNEYVAFNVKNEIVFYTPDFQLKRACKLEQADKTSEVTSILALSNFNIVCVSTLDKELQFYHSTSNAFELCLTIFQLPALVTCLAYTYNIHECKIGLGDMMGNVIVIMFSSEYNILADIIEQKLLLGKMKTSERARMTNRLYNFAHIVTVVKRQEKATGRSSRRDAASIHAVHFPELHNNQVKLLEFADSGKYIVSTSSTSRKSMAYCHVESFSNVIKFALAPCYVTNADGLYCLCMCAAADSIIATGHSDNMVRLWDVYDDRLGNNSTTTTMTNTKLIGHVTAVICVFYNHTNKRLYSVTANCVIKVWDVYRTTCLVTFDGAAIVTFGRVRASSFFGHFNQLEQVIVMVAGMTIVTVKCGDTDSRSEHCDTTAGSRYSHESAVVKTMYNSLFHVLISMSGLDSTICVWNPCTGDLIIKWSMAHTKVVYGEILPVEITAANFDPSGGLLVTGAANGTVHVWDPNDGTCLNRLKIPSKSRISEIVWLPNKILVTASDRQVTEFNEPLTVSSGKVWLWNHDGAVLSACVKPPSLFVTTSSTGEMGFWRLETGQLVKKHKAKMRPDKSRGSSKYSKSSMSTSKFSTISSSYMSIGNQFNPMGGGTETREEMFRRLDIKLTPREHYAAVASHFLRGRPEALRIGTLLVATRNGVVQLWCTYKVPKYVAQFVAIHTNNDYVTAMASDSKNDFLFTSLNSGYVKTWYIANFGVGLRRGVIQNVGLSLMPSLRLRFPFLLESFFVGRAERENSLKNTAGPLLVNSYKAHTQCISHIEYINKQELVVTSSKDKLVRIWTLAGHYVGALGSPWPCTQKTGAINITSSFIVPLDIKHEASFTTIKVLMDGINSSLRTPLVWDKLIELRQQREMESKIVQRTLQGKKCPKQPLHDVYNESIETKEASDKDPNKFKVEMLKSKVQVFKYMPLYKLATISKIDMSKNI